MSFYFLGDKPLNALTLSRMPVGLRMHVLEAKNSKRKHLSGKLFKSLMNAYLPGWETRAAGRASRLCGTSGVHFRAKEAHSP